MGLADVKNDIKIILYIINFFIGLAPGLYLFGCGIAFGANQYPGKDPAVVSIYVVVGIVVLGLAALGYAGAILENKIMLFVYAGFMLLTALASIVSYLVIGQYSNGNITLLAGTIAHVGLVVIDVALAVMLGLQAGKSSTQGRQGIILSPAPTMYSPGV